MIARLLFSAVVFVAACSARESNCTTGDAPCMAMRMAKRMNLNGQTVCCSASAEFRISNNDCKCAEPYTQEEPCVPNETVCRQQGISFNTDSQNNLRCCMPGQTLSVRNNGDCMCTPFGNNGFSMPNVPGVGGQSSQTVNGTDIREQWKRIGQDWKNFGRQFVGGVSTWARNFGSGARQTGQDLARNLSGVLQSALRSSVDPVQRALNDLINHAFRG